MADIKKSRDKADAQIKGLEEELAKTKYNKRTQHHIGLVKAKIAKLKEKQIKRSAGRGKPPGYSVKKTGEATVIIVGFPSVGKSTLLNALTNAKSPVGHYAFTTLTCIPGLMEYNHAKIQILDVPGVIEGAASGRGRGKEVLACAMSADLVLFLIDVFGPENIKVIEKEVYESNLRVNARKPDVRIEKTSRGGITVGSTVRLTKVDPKTVESVLKEFRVVNANVVIREDITIDQLIDVLEDNKIYLPAITLLNKIDLISEAELEKIKKKVNPDICISADKKIGIEQLKELIFEKLNFMRVYCKEVGKKADLDEPLIVFRGATLKDVCLKLHKDFINRFRFARIWGKSARFPGMAIRKFSHKLIDGDIIEIHVR